MMNEEQTESWKKILAAKVLAFGHRNWIVVADAAYPMQSGTGIKTIISNADHMEVIREALMAIQAVEHIRPNIYLDLELDSVSESDACGISNFRQQLYDCLDCHSVQRLLHEEIITSLDRASSMFEILILKTTSTIPYTSVFMELDCGYWSDAAEQRLRRSVSVPCDQVG
jgi:hypothetical protein